MTSVLSISSFEAISLACRPGDSLSKFSISFVVLLAFSVFSISKLGNIAGCFVKEGIISRNSKIRILRDNVVIHTGAISSLKRFKEEVKEVKTNYECGVMIENYSDISKFIKNTKAAKAPIIPVSAQSHLNLDALIYSIEETIKLLKEMKQKIR